MDESLKFVSNVIELKPDRKYLLVFKGNVSIMEIDRAGRVLREQGFDCISLSLGENVDMDVIEVPKEQANG